MKQSTISIVQRYNRFIIECKALGFESYAIETRRVKRSLWYPPKRHVLRGVYDNITLIRQEGKKQWIFQIGI